MKIYKNYYTSKTFFCVLLWLLIIVHPYQALSEESSGDSIKILSNEEMPRILQLIGDQIRGNYERITTWSGEISEKITWVCTGAEAEVFLKNATDTNGVLPETILHKVEDKITFAVDVNKSCLYINSSREKEQYLNPATDTFLERRWEYPVQSTSIYKPSFQLRVEPVKFDKNNRIIQSRATKTPSRQNSRTGLYESSFEPRRIFAPGCLFTWDLFDTLIGKIERFGKLEFDGYSLKIEEHHKGDVTEYKVILPSVMNLERSKPEHYVIQTKVFSSQCGFNMIYWEVASGNGLVIQTLTFEYELIDGVYLPKRKIEKYYSYGQVETEKDYTYINNNVNHEILQDTFSISSLELKNGDKFIDKILDKEYVYQDGELTPKTETD